MTKPIRRVGVVGSGVMGSGIDAHMANAGLEGGVIINRLLKKDEFAFGFDALKEDYCDLFERGVVDPTKVTRSALLNAASVSSILLTTSCAIADLPEEEAEEAQARRGEALG